MKFILFREFWLSFRSFLFALKVPLSLFLKLPFRVSYWRGSNVFATPWHSRNQRLTSRMRKWLWSNPFDARLVPCLIFQVQLIEFRLLIVDSILTPPFLQFGPSSSCNQLSQLSPFDIQPWHEYAQWPYIHMYDKNRLSDCLFYNLWNRYDLSWISDHNAHDKYEGISGHRSYYDSLFPALKWFLGTISIILTDLEEGFPVIILASPTLVPWSSHLSSVGAN